MLCVFLIVILKPSFPVLVLAALQEKYHYRSNERHQIGRFNTKY